MQNDQVPVGARLEDEDCTAADANEYHTLGDLVEYLQEHQSLNLEDDTQEIRDRSISTWFESVYFPAKESLIDLLVELGLLVGDEEGADDD